MLAPFCVLLGLFSLELWNFCESWGNWEEKMEEEMEEEMEGEMEGKMEV